MMWISVNDRLPNNAEYVLASDGNYIYILCFIKTTDRNGYFDSSDDCDFFDEITHWMPLPELPYPEMPSEEPKLEKERIENECKEYGHIWTWMPKNQKACMRCGRMDKEND